MPRRSHYSMPLMRYLIKSLNVIENSSNSINHWKKK
ncbi:Uncharacterised protein [Vibrio cholerae]|nr:Uncharacterised protein [Vibrio cholerae]CSC91273.1 Uncharacterised protein [Vibrio cholerae]CSD12351.1 Uncharacterised protein [Vibrio cholerae]